jgi:CheY-like chemotaxis protein
MSSIDLAEQPLESAQDPHERPAILVIDHDEAMVAVLSRRLEGQGFQVVAVDRGLAGLEIARKRRPALILLDLRLPDIDGFTVCEQLADCSQTWDIPIIVLSGMGRPDIVRRSRAAGCRYFIRKPYDPNALLVLINQAMEATTGWEDEWP